MRYLKYELHESTIVLSGSSVVYIALHKIYLSIANQLMVFKEDDGTQFTAGKGNTISFKEKRDLRHSPHFLDQEKCAA